MQELITITQKALQSQFWKMKAQGAAAMASIAKQTGSLVPPHLGIVLSALLQGLPGRTWTGKVRKEVALHGSLGTSMEPLSQDTQHSVLQSIMCRNSGLEGLPFALHSFGRYKNDRGNKYVVFRLL